MVSHTLFLVNCSESYFTKHAQALQEMKITNQGLQFGDSPFHTDLYLISVLNESQQYEAILLNGSSSKEAQLALKAAQALSELMQSHLVTCIKELFRTVAKGVGLFETDRGVGILACVE
jgi:hypothetical protein